MQIGMDKELPSRLTVANASIIFQFFQDDVFIGEFTGRLQVSSYKYISRNFSKTLLETNRK